MPNGQITRHIPGRGLVVVGFKVPDGGVNFKYVPGKGSCPIQTSQSKNSKETLVVNDCPVILII
uniref:Uncharacterized protein n=1 Tax=viral metagenome TaxID=1070528 RepID=A0A6C0CUV5_9ZZZZ